MQMTMDGVVEKIKGKKKKLHLTGSVIGNAA